MRVSRPFTDFFPRGETLLPNPPTLFVPRPMLFHHLPSCNDVWTLSVVSPFGHVPVPLPDAGVTLTTPRPYVSNFLQLFPTPPLFGAFHQAASTPPFASRSPFFRSLSAAAPPIANARLSLLVSELSFMIISRVASSGRSRIVTHVPARSCISVATPAATPSAAWRWLVLVTVRRHPVRGVGLPTATAAFVRVIVVILKW